MATFNDSRRERVFEDHICSLLLKHNVHVKAGRPNLLMAIFTRIERNQRNLYAVQEIIKGTDGHLNNVFLLQLARFEFRNVSGGARPQRSVVGIPSDFQCAFVWDMETTVASFG